MELVISYFRADEMENLLDCTARLLSINVNNQSMAYNATIHNPSPFNFSCMMFANWIDSTEPSRKEKSVWYNNNNDCVCLFFFDFRYKLLHFQASWNFFIKSSWLLIWTQSKSNTFYRTLLNVHLYYIDSLKDLYTYYNVQCSTLIRKKNVMHCDVMSEWASI